jgi:hypothetical protein
MSEDFEILKVVLIHTKADIDEIVQKKLRIAGQLNTVISTYQMHSLLP